MFAGERPLCDCPEPCDCYAAGRDKAYTEVLASLEDSPQAGECPYRYCQVKTACMRTLLTIMANWSPELFERVEAWALEDHDHRN